MGTKFILKPLICLGQCKDAAPLCLGSICIVSVAYFCVYCLFQPITRPVVMAACVYQSYRCQLRLGGVVTLILIDTFLSPPQRFASSRSMYKRECRKNHRDPLAATNLFCACTHFFSKFSHSLKCQPSPRLPCQTGEEEARRRLTLQTNSLIANSPFATLRRKAL